MAINPTSAKFWARAKPGSALRLKGSSTICGVIVDAPSKVCGSVVIAYVTPGGFTKTHILAPMLDKQGLIHTTEPKYMQATHETLMLYKLQNI